MTGLRVVTAQRALAPLSTRRARLALGAGGQGRTTNGIDESPLTRHADSMRFGAAGGWEQEVLRWWTAFTPRLNLTKT